MTIPGRTLLFIVALIAALLVGAIVWPDVLWASWLGDALLIGACLAQGRTLKNLPVTVQRDWPLRVQIDRPAQLRFRVDNRSRRPVNVVLRQPWPVTIDADRNQAKLRVAAGESVTVAIAVTPRQRGRVDFDPLEVTIHLADDLARRRWATDIGGHLTVYPNLDELCTYDTLRRSRALQQMGVHRQRMVGAGREFEQLRDYLPDDDYRDVNWKATARQQKPITNLYQAERSRDVVICVDAGRMMGNPVGSGTALDRAVDAAILLAHASNRQGDRVGLSLFTDRVDALLKPAAGSAAVHAIIERLVDVTAQPRTPAYASLVEALRASQNHRSLVFIFTDLNDPQLARDLAELMPLLSRRHMVVTVSLRDGLLDRSAAAGAHSSSQVYQVLAARALANERDEHRRALTQAGVQTLEADAEGLSLAVINRYMAIKSRQLL